MSDETALILAIASRERNLELLTSTLRDAGYAVATANDLAEFDELLDDDSDIGLSVLDIDGFTAEIWDRCAYLADRGVPLLVLSRRLPAEVRQKALETGARVALEKPVRKAELRNTVKTLAGV